MLCIFSFFHAFCIKCFGQRIQRKISVINYFTQMCEIVIFYILFSVFSIFMALSNLLVIRFSIAIVRFGGLVFSKLILWSFNCLFHFVMFFFLCYQSVVCKLNGNQMVSHKLCFLILTFIFGRRF